MRAAFMSTSQVTATYAKGMTLEDVELGDPGACRRR